MKEVKSIFFDWANNTLHLKPKYARETRQYYLSQEQIQTLLKQLPRGLFE